MFTQTCSFSSDDLVTGKTQGGNEVCKFLLSLWQRTWLTLLCNSVLFSNGSSHSGFTSCWWVLCPAAFGEQGILGIPGRTRVWMGQICESPVRPTSYLLPRTSPLFFFFFLVHSPLKSFISWEWAIKKIRIFFFSPSPQSFVTCPIKLTATYKEKYPLKCLDALQDFQLGHPVSLLCPCAHFPGADRSGERKKKSEEVGEEDGGETNTKCSDKTRNKTSSPTLMLFPFSTSSIRCTISRQGNF